MGKSRGVYFDKKYIRNTIDPKLVDFIGKFSIDSDSFESRSFLEENLEDIFSASEKMLGVGVDEINSTAMDFYRSVGLDNCATYLVNFCFGSKWKNKKDLSVKLFLETEKPSVTVLESLYFGFPREKAREDIIKVLKVYKEKGFV